jgi:hypothetical protein
MISLFDLHGFKTWPLTQREEHRLGMSENKLLKKILNIRKKRGWNIFGIQKLHFTYS